MRSSFLRNRLQELLARLAAPAEEQIAHLQELGTWPSADELALELDDLVGFFPEARSRGELSEEEETLIRQVDDLLERMSGKEQAELWNVSQLASAKEWAEVRRLAGLARDRLMGRESGGVSIADGA
jgi:hypothetical protein